MQSQIENYRAKAREFARLTLIAKSLRDSRQYRKLADMYWALALGEEPERVQPSKPASEGAPNDDLSCRVSRRLEQKWATRVDQILTVIRNAPPPRDPNDDDDEEEEDEDDEDQPNEPAVVREPDED